jgi:hypothetical protein
MRRFLVTACGISLVQALLWPANALATDSARQSSTVDDMIQGLGNVPWWAVALFVGALMVLLAWRYSQRRAAKPMSPAPAALASAPRAQVQEPDSLPLADDALTTAKRRLAAGEITADEYDQIGARLG